MSIASEINRLQQAKVDIKTAIENKGVSVPSSAKLDSYSTYVDSIEQSGGGGGGESSSGNDVIFIDYDGSIVESYSAADFANLTALPNNPDHTSEGLVSQGWNWTLSNAKTYVAEYGKLAIGQMYVTNDGATKITFDMSDWEKPWPITMQFTQSKANGVAVDWGDGSAVERGSGTSNVTFNHTYSSTGVYVISLLPDSDCTLTIFGNTSYGSNLFAQSNNDRFKIASVKAVNIGFRAYINSGAFCYCYSLQSVSISSSVTSIGDYAFQYCYALQSVVIPSSVTSIGSSMLAYCHSFQSVSIPSSVTSIGSYAFQYCHSLKSVTIPSGVTSIGYAFYYCYSLQSVVIPSSVTSIGDGAFQYCSALQSVVIPSSVTSIGNYALYNCSALQSVVIPNRVTRLGNNALSGCSALQSVVIPSSVTSIGSNAFSGCSPLQSVVIPSSVTSIGNYMLAYCSTLQSVVIPSSVTSIGSNAFNGCNSLREMIFERTTPPTLGGASNSLGQTTYTFPIYVPDSAVSSYKNSYSNYSSRIKGISERP